MHHAQYHEQPQPRSRSIPLIAHHLRRYWFMIGRKWSSFPELGTVPDHHALSERIDGGTNVNSHLRTSSRLVSLE
jgi:hypothetical protein